MGLRARFSRLGNSSIVGSALSRKKKCEMLTKEWINKGSNLMSERLDHGEVGDDLERVDILDEDVAGDVLELDVVQEDGHFLAKLCGIAITVVLTPH